MLSKIPRSSLHHEKMQSRGISDFLERKYALFWPSGDHKQNHCSGLIPRSGPEPESASSSVSPLMIVRATRGQNGGFAVSQNDGNITLFRSSAVPPSLSGASLGFRSILGWNEIQKLN